MRTTLSGLRITTIILIAFVIAFGLYSQQASAATKDSGDCGLDAEWVLDDTGKLTIGGSGYMDDYDDSGDAPWYQYASDIKKIEVKSGIKSIGDYAFSKLYDVETIKIPDNLEMIGENAFECCERVKTIDVPGSVQEINELAFSDCISLQTLILRKGVIEIGDDIVFGCSDLEIVHYTGTLEDWDYEVCCYTDFGDLLEFNHDGRLDRGKVTKKPTCSSKGVRTFTCTICGDKKTEAIAKDPKSHKYGKWTKLNAKQHWRVCNLNKAHVEKASHKWVKTKRIAPTLDAKGAQKYKCTTCGAVKSVSIPKRKPTVLTAKATSTKPTSATIAWNRVPEAGRYQIYVGQCGIKGIKLVKTVKGGVTSYALKNLDKTRKYKFKVVVQKKTNGKWRNISPVSTGHFVTDSNRYYTNPKSLKVNRTSLKMKKGKTAKVKAEIIKKRPVKLLLSENHDPRLRYKTSDKSIATVSESGKITAKGKGTCTIYVIAINGVSKGVKVTIE